MNWTLESIQTIAQEKNRKTAQHTNSSTEFAIFILIIFRSRHAIESLQQWALGYKVFNHATGNLSEAKPSRPLQQACAPLLRTASLYVGWTFLVCKGGTGMNEQDTSKKATSDFWKSYFAKFRRTVEDHEVSETAPAPLAAESATDEGAGMVRRPRRDRVALPKATPKEFTKP